MDFFDLTAIDKNPKRRKDKYNPYKIFTIGIDTAHPRYFVSIKSSGETFEISEDIFYLLNQFELEDLSYLNKKERHHEFSVLTDEGFHLRQSNSPPMLEDIIQQRLDTQRLHIAIQKLHFTQRKRLIMYYFDDYTLQQIATKEGCSKVAIKHSINVAIKNLRKILETLK